jgi:hypothetical protein
MVPANSTPVGPPPTTTKLNTCKASHQLVCACVEQEGGQGGERNAFAVCCRQRKAPQAH